jgi:hypothetical protein
MPTRTPHPPQQLSDEELHGTLFVFDVRKLQRLLDIRKAYQGIPNERLPRKIRREVQDIYAAAYKIAGRTPPPQLKRSAIIGRLKARDWLSALSIGGVVTFILFLILAAPLYQWLGDAVYLLFFIWPLLVTAR